MSGTPLRAAFCSIRRLPLPAQAAGKARHSRQPALAAVSTRSGAGVEAWWQSIATHREPPPPPSETPTPAPPEGEPHRPPPPRLEEKGPARRPAGWGTEGRHAGRAARPGEDLPSATGRPERGRPRQLRPRRPPPTPEVEDDGFDEPSATAKRPDPSRWVQKPVVPASREDALHTLRHATEWSAEDCERFVSRLPASPAAVVTGSTATPESPYTTLREVIRLWQREDVTKKGVQRLLETATQNSPPAFGPCRETMELLRSLRLRGPWLQRAAMHCPQLLLSPAECIREACSTLKGHDVPGDQLFKVLRREPGVFLLRPRELQAQLAALREAGIRPQRMAPAVRQCPRLLLIAPRYLALAVAALRSLGLSPAEAAALVNRAPQVLRYHPDTLRLKWRFFAEQLGLDRARIVKHGKDLVCASLPDKLGPRTALLRRHGLRPDDLAHLRLSDAEFCRTVGLSLEEWARWKAAWAAAEGRQWAAETLSPSALERLRRRQQSARTGAGMAAARPAGDETPRQW
eukprot:EG_transcript_8248